MRIVTKSVSYSSDDALDVLNDWADRAVLECVREELSQILPDCGV